MSEALWVPEFEAALRGCLPYLEGDQPLPPDASLIELGLDSMQAVTLVINLEAVLGIAFPEEALTPQTFSTPAVLWSAVAALRTWDGSASVKAT
jgi:acyl carrier protein